ncbi:hypothetical protein HFE01_25665 [Paenibacillus sp. EKM10P]|nr:hypothetical protein HFE01_25665 [Paenibacillus sp. EKM10P]
MQKDSAEDLRLVIEYVELPFLLTILEHHQLEDRSITAKYLCRGYTRTKTTLEQSQSRYRNTACEYLGIDISSLNV